MQCNQPLFYTGFHNNAQYPPHYTQSLYPEVIGEGDVMSYILPDGNIQYYFVPTNRHERWIPHSTNPYYMPSSYPTWTNNKEAWFVRSILNTYPTAGPFQLPNNYGDSFSRSNITSPINSFVQKFHNDGWTSTTDLHYFFPTLRHDWAKGCAAIQVEIPSVEKSIFHYETICNRPCYCNQKTENTKVESNNESDRTETPMCIDEVKSTHSSFECRKKEKKHKTESHSCAGPSKSSHSCTCPFKASHSCACPTKSRVEIADKVVTTYTDQAISCTDMKSNNKKGKRRTSERTDVAPEMWYPRVRKSKKISARSSSSVDTCDGACRAGCACSDTEFDGK